jgi:uncharacterized protein (TIGR02757 family)
MFHHPRYISPDPLEVVREYERVDDREVVGLIASSLALGRVASIIKAVRTVLDRLRTVRPTPAQAVSGATPRSLRSVCSGFRHRFFDEEQLYGLLLGAQAVLRRFGSLEACVRQATRGSRTVPLLEGLDFLVGRIVEGAKGRLDRSILLARPDRKSACKRLLLYARWMVRRDEVDPGGWRVVGPEALLVPVDTHVLRVARTLDITSRSSPSLAVSREITDVMRQIVPEDPVRYDFALTRPGIHPLLDEAGWLASCGA